MESPNSSNANDMVLQVLSQFFCESELNGLGGVLVGIIRYELRKADLASPERVWEVLEDSLLEAQEQHESVRMIGPFLKAVGRNKARRTMRTEILRMKNEERTFAELQSLLKGKEPLQEEPSQDLLDRVLDAISQLPESTRVLLRKIYVEELPNAQIVAEMELSPVAVRVRKHRALTTLREKLDVVGEEERKAG